MRGRRNEEAKRLRVEEQTHSIEAKISKKQASRVEGEPGEEEKDRGGYSVRLWTTSTKGARNYWQ